MKTNKVTQRNKKPQNDKLNAFIESNNSLEKFALSLYLIKEMASKHPHLKQAAINYLNA
jgi:hypothetical protein